MSGVIHFTSGKVLKISEEEFIKLAPKLHAGGLRVVRIASTGHLMPLNSNTIEMVEHIKEEDNVTEPVGQSKPVVDKPKVERKTVPSKSETEDKGPVAEVGGVEEPKESAEEKQQKALARMIELSNCKHDSQSVFVQQTKAGARYFPVCDKCGKRERYLSEVRIRKGEDKVWSADDLDNAQPYVER